MKLISSITGRLADTYHHQILIIELLCQHVTVSINVGRNPVPYCAFVSTIVFFPNGIKDIKLFDYDCEFFYEYVSFCGRNIVADANVKLLNITYGYWLMLKISAVTRAIVLGPR